MKKIVIAAAIVLVLLAAAGILIVKKDSNPNTDPSQPNVRIMTDNTPDLADEAMQRQLDELRDAEGR